MSTFLHNVAQKIWQAHEGRLEKVLVVFNNRRAGLFLQDNLKELDSKPFFLPRIIGIDDLVDELGECQIAPHEFLLFELFDIHRNLEGAERRFETFEEFMSFGEMMIRDFSELDLYMVDARKLFENIHDLKRLGEWDIEGKPLTSFQEKYLNFYKSLHQYYSLLRTRLQEQHQAYTGMAYRLVAENIDTLADKLSYSHIYFVGFNALSNCELRIIDSLVRRGMATTIFDGDSYYFDDTRQEAGLFLRRHAARFPNVGGFDENFAATKKTIHIINCPENILQAKAAGQIVAQLDAAKTAVVLADESLLLPMLNSLPDNVQATNVTMGFPFILTAIHNLVSKILSLCCRSRDDGFYHADVNALLSDHIISRCLNCSDIHTIITKALNDSKAIRLKASDISALLNKVDNIGRVMFLFEKTTPSADDILTILRQLVELVEGSDILAENNKEKEALACMLQTVDYLDSLQKKYRFVDNADTLQRIYLRLAQRRSVAFYGEPLSGMQLLGMLETRSLDFSNVVVISVNEGVLPAGRNDNSLIPLSLKRAFGLPTFEEKDAVYAYHFFRLLQRADKAWLLYSSDAEGMGKGEPSRFIMQVCNELAVRYPNIEVVEQTLTAFSAPLPMSPTPPRSKDKKTVERLVAMATAGFSPSALNRYRNCPMQFFFEDVLGAHEYEEVSEEVLSNELGTFIHSILCQVYEPYKGKAMPLEALETALNDLDKMVDDNVKADLLKGRSREGKNHIYAEVAKMQLSNFLKNEIACLKEGHRIDVVMTEDEMNISLTLDGGDNTQVLMKGIADRVDRIDGLLRIADYKSGRVDARELKVTEPAPNPHEVPDKWFQVMAYAWLFFKKHPELGGKPFLAGIFPLRNLSSEFMAASWEGSELLNSMHLDRFEALLKELLAELLNPATPFTASPRKDGCTYCPFARSCRPVN